MGFWHARTAARNFPAFFTPSMYSVITFVFGSEAKNSIRSASSTSTLFPMLTNAEKPSLSSAAQSIRAAPTVPLCDAMAIAPFRVMRGQDAHRPWCG
jgi:hypothetical protein